MDLDLEKLKGLAELLQGGGTAGLLAFGYFMMRAFKDLREKIDGVNKLTGEQLGKIRERLVRIEVELEHLSKQRGGDFRADSRDPERT